MPEQTPSARFPTDLPAWKELNSHFRSDMMSATIGTQFAAEPERFDDFSLEAGDLFLDYSKNLVSQRTRQLLLALADEAGVASAIDEMFAGNAVNVTEARPALHVALRAEPVDGVAPGIAGTADVRATLDQIGQFVADVQNGAVRGKTGRRLTNVVNIGIGGSDLGVVMAARALRHYWRPGMNFYSVSNVDGTQLTDLTEALNPEETLFVICSKTFTTQETMVNAKSAANWMAGALGTEAIGNHFAAASTNHSAMDEFGINPAYRFGFWDWVGGRYSLWSAVGLSLALVTGMEHFRELLSGAREMDRHFLSEPAEQNMPVLLALMAIWYNNFFEADSHAILPYDNRLDRFPAFLQQLQMESNGKRVRRDGHPVNCKTGQIIWGEAGSNAQHSFYQLLHQGTRTIPVDFLLPIRSSGGRQEQQDLAIANCLAQSEALMDGYSEAEALADLVAAGVSGDEARALAPHKTHLGDNPSNTILFESLTPAVLGQLVALYEHKVFVESVVWGINPFDQWGVELGKRLAGSMTGAVSADSGCGSKNPSTSGLLGRISRLR